MKVPRPTFNDIFRSQEFYYGISPSDGLVQCVSQHAIAPCPVLDAGCGQGRNALWLAKLGFDVLAIDNSSEAILQVENVARHHSASVTTLLGDLRTIELPKRRFGLVVLQTTLNHIPAEDLANVCDRLIDSLAVGGFIYCVCFTEGDPGTNKEIEVASECADLVVHYFKPMELKGLFSALDILHYVEYRKLDTSHGAPHYHAKAKLVARCS